MLSLVRAEWQKTTGNKWATGFTVWTFPAGAIGIFVFLMVLIALGLDMSNLRLDDIRWTDQMLMAWQFAAGNIFGQIMLAALAATIFAGESMWNTWKNIVPRQSRVRLLLAKFAVTGLLIFLAFTLTSLIAGLGSVLLAAIAGQPITPAVDGTWFGQFVPDYAATVLFSGLTMLLVATYAMLVAIITRSVLFGVVGGVGLMTLDMGAGSLAVMLNVVTGSAEVFRLAQIMPSYNLANLQHLAIDGTALVIPLADGVLMNSAATSSLLVTGWFVGLMGLALWVFSRRDVT